MKYLNCISVAILTLISSLSVAEEIILDTPNTATTLPLKNRYASTFFTVDEDNFNVVVAVSMGTDVDDQLVRQIVQLADGQTFQLSIGGYADHENATTIRMHRKKDLIITDVQSCETRESMANCI
jgi:hypothetical protein